MIVDNPISLTELSQIAENYYVDMVKAVVDVSLGRMAIDAELHSDLETLLLNSGSQQSDLWGINLYPQADEEDFIEFDSLINIRPRQNNRSRGVEDSSVCESIKNVVISKVVR